MLTCQSVLYARKLYQDLDYLRNLQYFGYCIRPLEYAINQ